MFFHAQVYQHISFTLFILYYKIYLLLRQSHPIVNIAEGHKLNMTLFGLSKIVILEFEVFSPEVDSHELLQLGH